MLPEKHNVILFIYIIPHSACGVHSKIIVFHQTQNDFDSGFLTILYRWAYNPVIQGECTMILNSSKKQRIILTETEFEYLQNMLDFGSTIEQALIEIRPQMSEEPWNLQNLIITVHRTREYSN